VAADGGIWPPLLCNQFKVNVLTNNQVRWHAASTALAAQIEVKPVVSVSPKK
jgi:hypothetical protein